MAHPHAADIDAGADDRPQEKRSGRSVLMAIVALFVVMFGAYHIFMAAMADSVTSPSAARPFARSAHAGAPHTSTKVQLADLAD